MRVDITFLIKMTGFFDMEISADLFLPTDK